MKKQPPKRKPRLPQESGAAMLIAIFALLLISVVAIALVVSSGTDSSLAGNYRTSTSAYYAAEAGLEEARGRLLWKNFDFINKTGSYSNVLFDPISGVMPAWCLNQVVYITNPAPGETVDPTSGPYADTEFVQEFPGGLGSVTVTQFPSVTPGVSLPGGGTLPGPAYKWARINAITELSLKFDVNGDGSATDPGILYYDPANLVLNKPTPGLIVSSQPPSVCPLTSPPTPTSVEALEITALAVAPNGGRRLLQYVVAPLILSPDPTDQNFPAALTLDTGSAGQPAIFQSPNAPAYPYYQLSGLDQGCLPAQSAPAVPLPVQSVAYTNAADHASIYGTANADKPSYPGTPTWTGPPAPGYTIPSVAPIPTLLRQAWTTPASLDAIMQDVVASADVIIQGPATGTDISNRAPLMSASNPLTIVVNGDLNLDAWHNSGYGLLLVTGTLHYDPNASWNGIVLVVGQGVFSSSNNGFGGFVGSVFVAKTRDAAGNLLHNTLGSAFYGSQTSFGVHPGYGICYSSTSVNRAKGPLTYKVLSFHEVPLP